MIQSWHLIVAATDEFLKIPQRELLKQDSGINNMFLKAQKSSHGGNDNGIDTARQGIDYVIIYFVFNLFCVLSDKQANFTKLNQSLVVHIHGRK